MNMVELKLKPFVKCLVLKVGLFETEIIDEYNFSINDEKGINDFETKYYDKEDCILVRIDM